MATEAQQNKAQQIQDILRLHFIEACTYGEITKQLSVSRPTARKYVDRFREIVSDDDMALKDIYKEDKRKVPFPPRWNKYVKKIVSTYARHPKRVATTAMRKKIILAVTDGLPSGEYRNATGTHKRLQEQGGCVPSYETVAKVLREHHEGEG